MEKTRNLLIFAFSIIFILLMALKSNFLLKNKKDALLIKNLNIKNNDLLKTPFNLKGEISSSWFFEIDFPIKIVDENNEILIETYAQALENWQTIGLVPFEAKIDFFYPKTEKSFLIIEKNNLSGLKELTEEIKIPVKFEIKKTKVKLFHYNENVDKQLNKGSINCQPEAVLAIEREVLLTHSPSKDTLSLLLKGEELTEKEKSMGFKTEFPLTGLVLKDLNLKDGLLKLIFEDPLNKTVGGSCRIKIL